MTPSDFLSCDWGTTTFRLRWVTGPNQRVRREIREPAGVRSLYEQAVREGAATEQERAPVFAKFLRSQLDALLAGQEKPARPLPLVISGMASSSVGWRELPYGKTPSPLDARGLMAETMRWDQPDWVGPTYLISGLATAHDIMRGEETEIIGLMADPALIAHREHCLIILPGTHSKHVRIENQAIVDWRTFMTGELFDVVGQHSLLRASVTVGARRETMSESDIAAFREGVLWVQEHGLAAGLFRVRTRAVLERRPQLENSWFLSGLLIGAELSEINRSTAKQAVILAAAGHLASLYELALKTIASQELRWIQIPLEQIETASIAAHGMFLRTRFDGVSR